MDYNYLIDGFNNGFKISDLTADGYNSVKHVEVNNHQSAFQHADLVEKE